MSLELTCPHCNFSTSISSDKIPKAAKRAICPKCKCRFQFFNQITPPDLAHSSLNIRDENHQNRIPGEGEKEQDTINQDNDKNSNESKSPFKEVKLKRYKSPWEKRNELGLWLGLYETLKMVLLSPERLFSTMEYDKGIKEPFAFGLLFGSIGLLFSLFWQFFMIWIGMPFFGEELLNRFNMSLVIIGIMIFSPLIVIAEIFITSWILHICLLIVRGGNNGFEGSFRVIAYSQAVNVLSIIPFIGGAIGWFWNMIIIIIGFHEIHETTYFRVIMALLLPLVLLILIVLTLVIFLWIMF